MAVITEGLWENTGAGEYERDRCMNEPGSGLGMGLGLSSDTLDATDDDEGAAIDSDCDWETREYSTSTHSLSLPASMGELSIDIEALGDTGDADDALALWLLKWLGEERTDDECA